MNTSPASFKSAAPSDRRVVPPLVPPTGMTAPDVLLQRKAEDAAALLKALANPSRLVILCQLVGGERTVGEIGALTGVVQPTLSQQLGVLRAEGLVATRRDGKRIHYRVTSPAVRALLATLYELFCADDADGHGPAQG